MVSEITFLKDSQWSKIDEEICRVISFVPMSEVRNLDINPETLEVTGQVKSLNVNRPYASIKFECMQLKSMLNGFITNKTDFLHL